MLKRHFEILGLLLITSACVLIPGVSAAQEQDSDIPDEWTEERAKCKSALDTAFQTLDSMVQRQAVVAPSSMAQGTNPVADMVTKLAEGQNKLAEVEQKKIEKMSEVNDEELKQIMGLTDKIHDFKQEDYKRRTELINLEWARVKADNEVKKQCYQERDKQYADLINASRAAASAGRLVTNSTGNMRGTRRRMTNKKKIFEQLCLASDEKQQAFRMNLEEFNAKCMVVKTENERILSDINYTEGKLDILKPHFEAKRQSVLDGAAAATNAIQQGNIMNLIGLGMAMSTSSAAANQGGAVAGNTVSASNTLENFGNIEAICNDPSNQSAITVPSDLYASVFSGVNRACRPDQSAANFCVKSNGVSQMLRNTSSDKVN